MKPILLLSNYLTLNIFFLITGDRFGLICAKVGLVYFLKKFKVEACDQTPVPLLLNPKTPFMVPRNPLMMTVKKLEEK